jgi:hypothetical protein
VAPQLNGTVKSFASRPIRPTLALRWIELATFNLRLRPPPNHPRCTWQSTPSCPRACPRRWARIRRTRRRTTRRQARSGTCQHRGRPRQTSAYAENAGGAEVWPIGRWQAGCAFGLEPAHAEPKARAATKTKQVSPQAGRPMSCGTPRDHTKPVLLENPQGPSSEAEGLRVN